MSCKILLGKVLAHVTKMSHLTLLVHICCTYILSVFKNYNSKKQLSEMKWCGKNCQLILTCIWELGSLLSLDIGNLCKKVWLWCQCICLCGRTDAVKGAGETARKGKGGNHFKDNQRSYPGKYLDCACVWPTTDTFKNWLGHVNLRLVKMLRGEFICKKLHSI